jgi:hypothetical protein
VYAGVCLLTGKSLPAVRHLTYATPNYSQAVAILKKTAQRWGIAGTAVYGPAHPVVAALAQRFPDIMAAKRGAGYWLWKPFVIRDALASATPGDAVLYTDAGVAFVADPQPLLSVLRKHPIVLFEHLGPLRQRAWTKRDCFVRLGADTLAHWDVGQLWAGMQLYRAGRESMAFVEAVCEAITQPDVLTDAPNVLGLDNLPGFKEHRHDQSVLTIVAQQFALPRFPDPSQWGPRAPQPAGWGEQDGIDRPEAPFGQVVHVHRKRNTGILKWYFRRLSRRYTGGHGFA